MAHMIDKSTGKAAIAYVGEKPWHELGHELSPNASIDEWTDKAGLAWEVLRSPLLYQDIRSLSLSGGAVRIQRFRDKNVLYRSDTGAALGIASTDYKVVQPREVLSFFDELIKLGNFQLETAGALSGGKRIWALAKIHDGAPIIGQDIVRPYLLLTTSFDGGMATTAKLTAIRVVCHNTLSIAVRNGNERTTSPVSAVVKVSHTMSFDPGEVRRKLGIFAGEFEKWLIQTRLLAEQEISRDAASEMVCKVLASIPIKTLIGSSANMQVISTDPKASRAYQRIMALFDGQAIGSELCEQKTKWQFVNSITQWIDHERGSDPVGRLNSAWFGPGEVIKRRAYELALAETL